MQATSERDRLPTSLAGALSPHAEPVLPGRGGTWHGLSLAGVLRYAILLAALPFFFESFHYTGDLPLLWAASKAFPIAALPLSIYALIRFRPPMRFFLIGTVYLLVALPTVTSGLYFHEDFKSALVSQTKLMPMTNYFSFLGLLMLLQPSHRELRRAFLVLGGLTMALMPILWAVLPSDVYGRGSNLFWWDEERGYRITLPIFFALVFLFYNYRGFLARGRLLNLGIAMAGVVILVLIYKERISILLTIGMMVLATVTTGPAWRRAAGLAFIVIGGIGALLSAGYFAAIADPQAGSLGVRLTTVGIATEFLNQGALRWLFGVGTISGAGGQGLQEYFDFEHFYLADIGWIGVLFEFGVVGVVLFWAYIIRIYAYYRDHLAGVDDLFLQALVDYLRYFILATFVWLPITYAPGEIAAMLAIFVYLAAKLDRLQSLAGIPAAALTRRA